MRCRVLRIMQDGHGGAIAIVYSSRAQLEACTISDCNSTKLGGAIYSHGPNSVDLKSCTLTRNSAREVYFFFGQQEHDSHSHSCSECAGWGSDAP